MSPLHEQSTPSMPTGLGRIFYFCPDFPQPSGGVRTLYQHVALLNQAGFDAAIVHQKHGFATQWQSAATPVLWLEDRPRFDAGDTLVFPEVMADMVRQTGAFGGRRVVIALSWTPSYSRLQPGERWQDLGVEQVLVQSKTVARVLAWSMGLEATYIPPTIDPGLYHWPASGKLPQVAYMTRKDRAGEWLQGVLDRDARGHAVAWTALRNLNEPAYAAKLRESAVYLATTSQEGLHISVLEAMACGCLVVGHTGIGGAEYMVGDGPQQNCILAENGNLLALGMALEEALGRLAATPDTLTPVIDAARATATSFQDPAAERAALVAFFSSSPESASPERG